jgi:phage/plasmid-associated DNA primase
MFQGYKYDVLPNPDYDKISHFLHHIKHIIAADDDAVHSYIMGWFASLLQKPTHKNKVMLLIQGRQGSGKTLFTDTLCHLLGEYGLPNVKGPENITGHFNAMIENKKLVILNELVSSDDDKSHIEYNSFKTIISEEIIDITAKRVDTREAQNILNLIITTNYMNSLRFNADDRRICPIITNNEYSRRDDDDPDFKIVEADREEYFDNIYGEIDDIEFYPTLFTYFMNYDITEFRPAKFPITQARVDIVESNKSTIDIFMEEYIIELQNGIITDNAYLNYKDLCAQNGNRGVYSKQKFLGELKRYCDTRKDTKNGTDGKRYIRLYLNAEGYKHFHKAIADAAVEASSQFGEIIEL